MNPSLILYLYCIKFLVYSFIFKIILKLFYKIYRFIILNIYTEPKNGACDFGLSELKRFTFYQQQW